MSELSEGKQRRMLFQELSHLEGYLMDRKRLAYKLPNGDWNMLPLTELETETIENRIKILKEMLDFE